jgi:hypothetical protein
MATNQLIQALAFGRDLSQSPYQGYNEAELSLIKKEHYYYPPLFDFLAVMGKNHGGLLDNDDFLLFQPAVDFFQIKKMIYELRDEAFFDKHNFLEAYFLLEANQGRYYFLNYFGTRRTNLAFSAKVCIFNKHEQTIEVTDWGLAEYLINRCVNDKTKLSTPQAGRLLANPAVPYVPPLADEQLRAIKKQFLSNIVQGSYPIAQLPVVGYTEHEIAMLEVAYDFDAHGELRDYLRVMGRDHGGICYDRDTTENISSKLFLIQWCKEILLEYQGEHLIDGAFLLFVVDTDHYFLPTRNQTLNSILHYASENNESVKPINETLHENLQRQFKLRLEQGLVQSHTAKAVRRLF